jgi:hypothetical protein
MTVAGAGRVPRCGRLVRDGIVRPARDFKEAIAPLKKAQRLESRSPFTHRAA